MRLPKRMAIYFRDSFDCVWCRSVFPICTKGYGLTLDHVDPDKGNDPANLVTCCGPCNSGKKDLAPAEWYERLAERGYNVRRIKERVARLTNRPLNLHAGDWLASLRRPKYQNHYPRRRVSHG